MTKSWPYVLAAVIGFMIYWFLNVINPDSRFCFIQIYKQQDGTYEVWWNCRSRYRKLANASYEQAKAFQIKECEELKAFMLQGPKGNRVK